MTSCSGNRAKMLGCNQRRCLDAGNRCIMELNVTKLTLFLRVGFINSHLKADKHFPANLKAITSPLKMSFMLEVKGSPKLIIKTTLIIAVHSEDIDWSDTNKDRCSFKDSTGLSSDQM